MGYSNSSMQEMQQDTLNKIRFHESRIKFFQEEMERRQYNFMRSINISPVHSAIDISDYDNVEDKLAELENYQKMYKQRDLFKRYSD